MKLQIFFLAILAKADPELDGNCLSQTINFDKNRMFALDGMPSQNYIKNLDTSRYDFTIDYYKQNVKPKSDGGVQFLLTKASDPTKNPAGPRVSTTRLMKYGKISVIMKAPATIGVVSTFITMAPQLPDPSLNLTGANPYGGDEIDWELVGVRPFHPETNIFYRGLPEYAVRGKVHSYVDGTGIDSFHRYTIDWKHDNITFLIDDQVVRVYNRMGSEATSANQKTSKRFFPDRPSKIQIALWSENTNGWAGGAAQFPEGQTFVTGEYNSLDIQCYDDMDQPVPKWPLSDNVDYKDAIKFQPTQGVNGAIPPEARPGFNGIIRDPNEPIYRSSAAPLTKNAVAISSLLIMLLQ